MAAILGVALVAVGTGMVVRRRRVAPGVLPNRWARGYVAYGGPVFFIALGVLVLADAAVR